MEAAIQEKVSTPAMALMAAGGIEILYCLGYAAWSALGIVMALPGLGITGLAAIDSGDGGALFGLGIGLWGLVIAVVAVVVDLILVVGAAMVIKAGMQLKALEAPAAVKRGAILAVAVPAINLILGTLFSLISLSFCGMLTGIVPSVVVLVVGGVACFLTLQVLGDDEVAAVYAVQED